MSSLDLDRERIIQALCAHYASDHLTTEELEARFDRAYKAKTPDELRALVANLPALPDASALPVSAPRPGGVSVAGPAEKRHLAVMSEFHKVGEWTPAPRNVLRALMANATFDLREALLSSGDTEFEVTAVMAEVNFIVPPGVRVESDVFSFMAACNVLHDATGDDPHAPLIRVKGAAVMATVNVETRFVGESAKDAKKRRKLEKR